MNTGNNLLFLIVAALLGFMAVSGIIGWLNIRNFRLRLTTPDEIYSGRETLFTIHLENRRRLFPSFLLRASILGSGADFPIIEQGKDCSASLLVRPAGRGRKTAGSCAVSSIFPVNFFVRFTHLEPAETFIVFPEPRRTPAAGGSQAREKDGAMETGQRGYEGDVAKIGEYTGAEPQKLIHWRLSAKHENFKVKEMSLLSEEPVVLDVAQLPGGSLEERLCHGVYLINRLIRQNRPVGLKLDGKVIPPAVTRMHRLSLLRELALYDQG